MVFFMEFFMECRISDSASVKNIHSRINNSAIVKIT